MNTLPTNWYIVATEDNYHELEAWRQTVASSYLATFKIGYPLLSEHHGDSSYYYGKSVYRLRCDSNYDHYQEITLEQFRQITNSTQKPMTKTIQISRKLLNEYYDAATTPQKEYMSKHFKLDGTTTDEAIRGLYELACYGWKPIIKANHSECFPEDSKYFDFSKYDSHQIMKPGASEALGFGENSDPIQIRVALPESESTYQYKGFWLNNKYDWELVRDNHNELVLVPTKK